MRQAVTLTFVTTGAVEDYTAQRREAFVQALALKAGVSPEGATVDVTAASVRLDVRFPVWSEAEGQAALARLIEAAGTVEAATELLVQTTGLTGVVVTAAPVVSLAVVSQDGNALVNVPSPPLPPPPEVGFGGLIGGSSALIVGLVAISVAATLYRRKSKRMYMAERQEAARGKLQQTGKRLQLGARLQGIGAARWGGEGKATGEPDDDAGASRVSLPSSALDEGRMMEEGLLPGGVLPGGLLPGVVALAASKSAARLSELPPPQPCRPSQILGTTSDKSHSPTSPSSSEGSSKPGGGSAGGSSSAEGAAARVTGASSGGGSNAGSTDPEGTSSQPSPSEADANDGRRNTKAMCDERASRQSAGEAEDDDLAARRSLASFLPSKSIPRRINSRKRPATQSKGLLALGLPRASSGATSHAPRRSATSAANDAAAVTAAAAAAGRLSSRQAQMPPRAQTVWREAAPPGGLPGSRMALTSRLRFSTRSAASWLHPTRHSIHGGDSMPRPHLDTDARLSAAEATLSMPMPPMPPPPMPPPPMPPPPATETALEVSRADEAAAAATAELAAAEAEAQAAAAEAEAAAAAAMATADVTLRAPTHESVADDAGTAPAAHAGTVACRGTDCGRRSAAGPVGSTAGADGAPPDASKALAALAALRRPPPSSRRSAQSSSAPRVSRRLSSSGQAGGRLSQPSRLLQRLSQRLSSSASARAMSTAENDLDDDVYV